MWRYEPLHNQWQKVDNWPYTTTAFATAFVKGNTAYIGSGVSFSTAGLVGTDRFYKYSLPLSVGSISAASAFFTTYPNPAADVLKLRGDVQPGDRYFIYDFTGRLLQQEKVNAQKQIDISQLLTGNYTIAIQIKGKISYQAFAKE